jgi:putative transcriptional regulator
MWRRKGRRGCGWQLTLLLISRSIMKLEFESQDANAEAIFKDHFAVERHDDRRNYGEERFVIIGMAEGQVLLFVAYTEREERIRIISARRATQNEQDDYFQAKCFRPMTSEDVERAALTDRDAQPLTEADLKRMKRTPQAKIIRRALDLTQEEFAVGFHIPLGTLRDWEQGSAEPDQPTRAYLMVIARDPEHVDRALNFKLA